MLWNVQRYTTSARAVRAGERIHVGVVDRRIGRDERRLAVAGRTCATGAQARHPCGQGEPERGECRTPAACSRRAHLFLRQWGLCWPGFGLAPPADGWL